MSVDYDIAQALDIHFGEYWLYVTVQPQFDYRISLYGYL